MRITAIDWPADLASDGLKDIRMSGLGKVVILAGKNGSGKSRLLKRLAELSGSRLPSDKVAKLLRKMWEEKKPLQQAMHGSSSGMLALTLESSPHEGTFWVKKFCPENLNSVNPDKVPPSAFREAVTDASDSFSGIGNTCWLYLQGIFRYFFDARNQESLLDEDTKNVRVEAYRTLKDLITELTGETPSHDSEHRLTLFGLPPHDANLSHGQKHLLQFAVALHAQGLTLRDTIVIMDEPENHLHAAALIDIVQRVANTVTNGQLWIATHSVPLIAAAFQLFADDLSLFCMEHGAVNFAGRAPERVLTSLMGGEENVNALRNFVSLPDTLARVNFAGQCLLPAHVVADAPDSDPQVELIQNAIQGLRRDGGPLRILEFGAGKGRILSTLSAILGDGLATEVDYVAWDSADEDRLVCERVISQTYGESKGRWYNNRASLFADHDTKTFDVVVMCNVLHEIDPVQWTTEFEVNGVIASALQTNGWLLVVEDYMMPLGEHSHRYGFVVLNAEHLKSLFDTTNEAGFLAANASGNYADRIRSHLIPAVALTRVSPATRCNALKGAHREAGEQIARLRSSGCRSYKDGLKHAFWTQQYANSGLALQQLNDAG